MSESPSPARPDITEMVAIHRVFRNAFAMAPRLIGGVTDGDAQRAAVVGGFLATIVRFLHVHQISEDDLLFPKLVERAPDSALVERIGAQHHDVDDAVAEVTTALDSWTASGAAADGERLVVALRDLEGATVTHLDDEESLILPVVEQHVSQEEWGALAGHPAMRTLQPSEVWLTLGLIREQFTDGQKARMDAAMPPQQLAAWKSVGLPAYKEQVAALVG